MQISIRIFVIAVFSCYCFVYLHKRQVDTDKQQNLRLLRFALEMTRMTYLNLIL